jgi:hypothetical protein
MVRYFHRCFSTMENLGERRNFFLQFCECNDEQAYNEEHRQQQGAVPHASGYLLNQAKTKHPEHDGQFFGAVVKAEKRGRVSGT